MQEVAELAGVGIATVGRVLNERGGVKPETARKVIAAARELGLPRILPSPYQRVLRFEVLLSRPDLPLIGRMSREFSILSESLGRTALILRSILADDRAEHFAERMRTTEADAVITYAPNKEPVLEAAATLVARGIPLITLISDLPAHLRLTYAGPDHRASGLTAGWFIARMAKPGEVLVLCNHQQYQAHLMRLQGLKDALTRHSDQHTIAEVIDEGDQGRMSSLLLKAAVRRYQRVTAIYDAGAAHQAVEAVIKQYPLGSRPTFIGHELTDQTRRMIDEGTMDLAIDQNPERQARFALETLLAYFKIDDRPILPNTSGQAPFTVHGPYNIGI
ncbi:LacI family DNA-binding transcriptional regulator [Phyllobacterium sp. YR531]|uniref:LacI family DNA-binding transcriptional regulator n=1 Tax=Phyllobacterium sp. YR531 TaxID=1144343 RepID=UPI000593F8A6|nr:LacI family DNA-binding transcriptional regulator [Phyllobacterium sp. YR531]